MMIRRTVTELIDARVSRVTPYSAYSEQQYNRAVREAVAAYGRHVLCKGNVIVEFERVESKKIPLIEVYA